MLYNHRKRYLNKVFAVAWTACRFGFHNYTDSFDQFNLWCYLINDVLNP